MRYRELYAVGLALSLALGCGDGGTSANVTGAVLIDGALASRGTVTFHPKAGGAPATGRVREDGSFSLRVGQGNPGRVDAAMIPAGAYRVTVIVNDAPIPSEEEGGPPTPGRRLMDSRYGSVDTTDLVVDVKPGSNLFNFDLDPAAAAEPDEAASEATEEVTEEAAEETAEPAAEAEADATVGEPEVEVEEPAAVEEGNS